MGIYTYGYAGRSVAELKREAERLDAYVADIRFMPHSKQPEWSQADLKRELGWRYTWIRALGNKNYKGISIQIENWDAGFEKLGALLATGRSVILLCMCRDLASCHRKVVADTIEREVGAGTVEHLGQPEPGPKPGALFGDGQ